jgi:hypothetical protein
MQQRCDARPVPRAQLPDQMRGCGSACNSGINALEAFIAHGTLCFTAASIRLQLWCRQRSRCVEVAALLSVTGAPCTAAQSDARLRQGMQLLDSRV